MVWEVDHFDGNGNRYVVRQGDIDAVAVVLAVSQRMARMDVGVLIRFIPATTIDTTSRVAWRTDRPPALVAPNAQGSARATAADEHLDQKSKRSEADGQVAEESTHR